MLEKLIVTSSLKNSKMELAFAKQNTSVTLAGFVFKQFSSFSIFKKPFSFPKR